MYDMYCTEVQYSVQYMYIVIGKRICSLHLRLNFGQTLYNLPVPPPPQYCIYIPLLHHLLYDMYGYIS